MGVSKGGANGHRPLHSCAPGRRVARDTHEREGRTLCRRAGGYAHAKRSRRKGKARKPYGSASRSAWRSRTSKGSGHTKHDNGMGVGTSDSVAGTRRGDITESRRI